ncbi:hypothetical protein Lalb_Chr14g0365431 [Lupinus albus]|uniref:Uncharacterized protein n=1 Tax=Lupinus albus TaxID=3870 RepID=A0A6A4P1I7_LUPAL|nr:hypothetical protein Lalb_Chr14g0365431 [Lupinus albus]
MGYSYFTFFMFQISKLLLHNILKLKKQHAVHYVYVLTIRFLDSCNILGWIRT